MMNLREMETHATHCCKLHGCKYSEEDCPVVNEVVAQTCLCEICVDEGRTLEGVHASKVARTSIPEENWSEHEKNCCALHGCEFRKEDCPVMLGLTQQKRQCERCDELCFTMFTVETISTISRDIAGLSSHAEVNVTAGQLSELIEKSLYPSQFA